MTAIALCGSSEATTSAVGSMDRFALDTAPAAEFLELLIATALPEPATAGTFVQGSMAMWARLAPCAERTATDPTGKIGHMNAETTAEAILEIRRRSGLIWEELGDLFGVSRRSVHHWANGRPVSAGHDRMIRRMLAAVRNLDRGDQERTRALLLTVDECMGISAFDLLRDGRFDEAMRRVDSIPPVEPQSTPLSNAAWEARQPPSPVLVLEAEQERPNIPANARAVRPRRTSKTAG